jgi:hypothetical protein
MKRTKNGKAKKNTLTLGKQTVRSLTEEKLEVVEGGDPPKTCYSDAAYSCCAMN